MKKRARIYAFLFCRLNTYGEPLNSIKEVFKAMRKPVIVRGSHPKDYSGLIGVIPTVKRVYDWGGFKCAVEKVRGIKNDERITKYTKDEGADLDEIHILLQEQQLMHQRAILVRHPTDRDIVIINSCDTNYDYRESFGFSGWRPDIVHEKKVGKTDRLYNLPQRTIKALLKLLRTVESSQTVDNQFAQQLEVGFWLVGDNTPEYDGIVFYQARPFKRFQSTDFAVTNYYKSNDDGFRGAYSESNFGITPKEGIDLPIVNVYEWMKGDEITIPEGDFALILHYTPKEDDYPIDVKSLKDMKVFIEPESYKNLAHGSYRYMQKAEVSTTLRKQDLTELMACKRIKVISNGKMTAVYGIEWN